MTRHGGDTLLDATRERRQLERWDERIERLTAEIQAELQTWPDDQLIDEEYVAKWTETARRLALKLNQKPPQALSPEAVAKVRGIIIDGLARTPEADQGPLDALDALLVNAEAVRHVIRDALDADLGVNERDAQEVFSLLLNWLPGVSLKEVGELVGRSDRQLLRWKTGGGVEAPERLVLVARLVALLRRSWTPRGIVAWFHRSRRQLDRRSPIELLDDPYYTEELLELARSGRSQHGT